MFNTEAMINTLDRLQKKDPEEFKKLLNTYGLSEYEKKILKRMILEKNHCICLELP